MLMKIIAIANTFNEGYILIGHTQSNNFYKARFDDYNVTSYSSSQRRIDVDQYIDTNDFDRIMPMSIQQVIDFMQQHSISYK